MSFNLRNQMCFNKKKDMESKFLIQSKKIGIRTRTSMDLTADLA